MYNDNRMISVNIEYCINVFSSFGITLTEEKNFKYDKGDVAIYLNYSGNDLIVRWDCDKCVYAVYHMNSSKNLSRGHKYHKQCERYSLFQIASFISTLHRPK